MALKEPQPFSIFADVFEQVRGVLAANAPIVGTARVAAATGKIVEALAVAIEIVELEEENNGGGAR